MFLNFITFILTTIKHELNTLYLRKVVLGPKSQFLEHSTYLSLYLSEFTQPYTPPTHLRSEEAISSVRVSLYPVGEAKMG